MAYGFGGTSNIFVDQDLAEFPNLAGRVFGDPGRSDGFEPPDLWPTRIDRAFRDPAQK